jgi:hypothetical protein
MHSVSWEFGDLSMEVYEGFSSTVEILHHFLPRQYQMHGLNSHWLKEKIESKGMVKKNDEKEKR